MPEVQQVARPEVQSPEARLLAVRLLAVRLLAVQLQAAQSLGVRLRVAQSLEVRLPVAQSLADQLVDQSLADQATVDQLPTQAFPTAAPSRVKSAARARAPARTPREFSAALRERRHSASANANVRRCSSTPLLTRLHPRPAPSLIRLRCLRLFAASPTPARVHGQTEASPFSCAEAATSRHLQSSSRLRTRAALALRSHWLRRPENAPR